MRYARVHRPGSFEFKVQRASDLRFEVRHLFLRYNLLFSADRNRPVQLWNKQRAPKKEPMRDHQIQSARVGSFGPELAGLVKANAGLPEGRSDFNRSVHGASLFAVPT